jgi:hypothetical protein
VNFDSWWSRSRRRLAAEDPYDTAWRLRRKLRRVRVAERPAFVNSLLDVLLREERAYGVVLFFLEGLSDPVYLERIAEGLRPLPGLQPDDEESHLADLLRILAAAAGPALPPAIKEYLLDRPIGPHWPSVPWALWPGQKELFASAWRRFFMEHHPDEPPAHPVVHAFLTEHEAVRGLRPVLAAASPELWAALRDALSRLAGQVRWLAPEQRENLDRAIS